MIKAARIALACRPTIATLGMVVACSSSARQPSALFAIVTETAVLRDGDLLPATSPIFDGSKVKLRAVRGETIAVVVALGAGKVATPTLQLAESSIAATRYALETVPVVVASTSLFGPSRGPGRYPDRLVAGASASAQSLFDLDVPSDARAGLHRGELAFLDRRIPVEIEVLPVSIDRRLVPLVWVWYLPAEIGRAHRLSGAPFAEQLEVERRYVDLFLDHGALLATDPAPGELEARQSLIHPSAPYWPVQIRDDDPEVLAANTRAAIEFFEPLAQTPFAIPIDEPATAEARARVAANGRAIAAAGGGGSRLLHVVTDRPRAEYDGVLDVNMSPLAISEPRAGDSLHRWTYNGRPPMAGALTIDSDGGSLRTWGWIAFRYNVELWHAWEGLYFTDRYNKATEPTDLSASMATFDERRRGGEDLGNGDGLLAYQNFEPSLRLKALRRGLLDRLLLAKLVACGGEVEARAIARATIPRALADAGGLALWPKNEAGWESARGQVLDAISARCPVE